MVDAHPATRIVSEEQFHDARFPEPGRRAVAVYEEGEEIQTEALLLRRGEWYYKVRLTFPRANVDSVHRVRDALVAASFNACEPTTRA